MVGVGQGDHGFAGAEVVSVGSGAGAGGFLEVRKELNVWDEVLANFPRYRLCKDLVRRLTGGRLKAILALRNGHVRLRDMPQELWAEDATERSAQWLEDQFPTADDVEELHFEWAPHSRESSQ